MKFYYEHENFNEVFNGNNTCGTSLLDIYYGHRNPIFEFNDSDNIIWHFNKAGDLNLEDIKKNITFYRNAF
jgi:hypothetical protein